MDEVEAVLELKYCYSDYWHIVIISITFRALYCRECEHVVLVYALPSIWSRYHHRSSASKRYHSKDMAEVPL